MVAYACIGIMFLYAVVRSTVYFLRPKHTPSPEEIDQHLVTILNREGERNE